MNFAITGDAFCFHGSMSLQNVCNYVKVMGDILFLQQGFSYSPPANSPNILQV